MRALLSYHIQAQLGYIVAAIGIGSNLAVAGAMSHLFNNILFKSLLFMAVGVVIYRTGEEDLYDLGGLWREMPLTAIGFGLGALSITAIPGFNGYVSKGMIFDAANPGYYGQPEYQALYWLLWLGAIGTLLSFIKLGYYVFFHGESDLEVADAKPGQTVAMLGLGGACLLFGVWWQGLADLAPTIHGSHFAFSPTTVAKATFTLQSRATSRRPGSSRGRGRRVRRRPKAALEAGSGRSGDGRLPRPTTSAGGRCSQ